ncbi:MAG: hypothetical protein PHI12_07045 [Dehalococcoidales bacterium]|nr:hypothetical protein [Dehalococcoidales bacterium]
MNRCELTLPKIEATLEQSEEWLWVSDNGFNKRRIRLHDYAEIYDIPGLYERVFCDMLKSRSWEVIPSMLSYEINKSSKNEGSLRVLDFGAGNGMVGEALLSQIECELMIGVDIIPEARKAAGRDRPCVYDEYHVIDMSQIEPATRKKLADFRFNCLVTVAALGFSDIPTGAFVEAFNLIQNKGWIAFNIKDKFLTNRDDTGFARLVKRILNNDILDVRFEQKYRHRFSIDGKELYYSAIVGKKKRDIIFDDFNPGD